jgi:hypothetical protein
MVTVAFGTTAPLGSVTVTRTKALSTCAVRSDESVRTTERQIHENSFEFRRMVPPLSTSRFGENYIKFPMTVKNILYFVKYF